MSITATEFKMNMSRYLALASTEDIYITQYGKIVAKLTAPFQDRRDIVDSLVGVIPEDISYAEMKAERLEGK